MQVKCDKCGKQYNLDPSKIKAAVVKINCPNCKNTIEVTKEAPVQAPPPKSKSKASAAPTGADAGKGKAGLELDEDILGAFDNVDLSKLDEFMLPHEEFGAGGSGEDSENYGDVALTGEEYDDEEEEGEYEEGEYEEGEFAGEEGEEGEEEEYEEGEYDEEGVEEGAEYEEGEYDEEEGYYEEGDEEGYYDEEGEYYEEESPVVVGVVINDPNYARMVAEAAAPDGEGLVLDDDDDIEALAADFEGGVAALAKEEKVETYAAGEKSRVIPFPAYAHIAKMLPKSPLVKQTGKASGKVKTEPVPGALEIVAEAPIQEERTARVEPPPAPRPPIVEEPPVVELPPETIPLEPEPSAAEVEPPVAEAVSATPEEAVYALKEDQEPEEEPPTDFHDLEAEIAAIKAAHEAPEEEPPTDVEDLTAETPVQMVRDVRPLGGPGGLGTIAPEPPSPEQLAAMEAARAEIAAPAMEIPAEVPTARPTYDELGIVSPEGVGHDGLVSRDVLDSLGRPDEGGGLELPEDVEGWDELQGEAEGAGVAVAEPVVEAPVAEAAPEAIAEPVVEPPVEEAAPEAITEPVVEAPIEAVAPEAVAEPVVEVLVEEAAPEAIAEPVVEPPVEEAAPEAIAEPVVEPPVEEAAPEAVAEPVVEAPVEEAAPEAVAEPVVEVPVAEAAPEAVAEPVVEAPVEEAAIEPVVEPPVEEAAPEAVAEPVVEVPVAEAAPEAIVEPVVEAPVEAAIPEVVAEPVVEAPVEAATPEAVAEPVIEAPVEAAAPEIAVEPVMEVPVEAAAPEAIAEPVVEAPVEAAAPEVVAEPVVQTLTEDWETPIEGEISWDQPKPPAAETTIIAAEPLPDKYEEMLTQAAAEDEGLEFDEELMEEEAAEELPAEEVAPETVAEPMVVVPVVEAAPEAAIEPVVEPPVEEVGPDAVAEPIVEPAVEAPIPEVAVEPGMAPVAEIPIPEVVAEPGMAPVAEIPIPEVEVEPAEPIALEAEPEEIPILVTEVVAVMVEPEPEEREAAISLADHEIGVSAGAPSHDYGILPPTGDTGEIEGPDLTTLAKAPVPKKPEVALSSYETASRPAEAERVSEPIIEAEEDSVVLKSFERAEPAGEPEILVAIASEDEEEEAVSLVGFESEAPSASSRQSMEVSSVEISSLEVEAADRAEAEEEEEPDYSAIDIRLPGKDIPSKSAKPARVRPMVAQVHCPNCQAVSTVDSQSIPDGGTTIKCPGCKQRYFVEKDPTSGIVSAGAPPKVEPVKEKPTVTTEMRVEAVKATGKRFAMIAVVIVVLAAAALGVKLFLDSGASMGGGDKKKAVPVYESLKSVESAVQSGKEWEDYAPMVDQVKLALIDLGEGSQQHGQLQEIFTLYKLAEEVWGAEIFWRNNEYQNPGEIQLKFSEFCRTAGKAPASGLPPELSAAANTAQKGCAAGYFTQIQSGDKEKIAEAEATAAAARQFLWAQAAVKLKTYWSQNKPE